MKRRCVLIALGVGLSGLAAMTGAGGIVPIGHVIHSDHEGSYASRYFGQIPASGLVGHAPPIVTISRVREDLKGVERVVPLHGAEIRAH